MRCQCAAIAASRLSRKHSSEVRRLSIKYRTHASSRQLATGTDMAMPEFELAQSAQWSQSLNKVLQTMLEALPLPKLEKLRRPLNWIEAVSERACRISSGSMHRFAPPANVSGHAVVLKTVTQGTPSQKASFCRPPESVKTTLDLAVRARFVS